MDKPDKPSAKLDRANRLMAIKRHPEFKKDYQELLKIRQTHDEQRIARKEYEIRKKWGESVEAIEKAEELYSPKRLPSVRPVISQTLPYEPLRVLYTLGQEVDGKEVIIEQPLAGERLYLEVDIRNYPVTAIMEDIMQIITHYKEILKDTGRNKEFTLDIWRIYDMKASGLNFSQIARQLSGIEGNPSYNDDLMKCYKQVKRAYEKARTIIETCKDLS